MATFPGSAKQLSQAKVSIARLNSSGAPGQGIEALAVVQLDSTGGIVSGGAGGGSTQVSVRDILTSSGVSVMDSTEAAIKVNVVAGAAGGSTYVSVRQSTAADLQMTATPASTVWTVQASTLGGRVLADQNSTIWETQGVIRDRDQSTQIAAVVNATPASTAYGIVVRLPAPLTDSTNNALRVFQVASSGGASSTEVTLSRVQDSSNGGVPVGDSENNAIRVNVVAGAAGGSTIVTVSTGSVRVVQSSAADLLAGVIQASTTWAVQCSTQQGRVAVAGYHADGSIVNVTDSTNNAINVNVVAGAAGGSTVVTVSTGSVRVHQSTAADLQVTAAPASTVWTVQASTLAGRVLADQNSTVWVTQPRLHTSSGGALEGSTARPSGNVLALPVRAAFPDLDSTTALITSSNSTATYNLVSSAAGLVQKVYAFVVTSTITAPSTFVFCSVGSSDNTTADKWGFELGSGSSGVSGANLAVSPPGWIFKSIAADAIKCRIESGSTGQIARVSVSHFSEA